MVDACPLCSPRRRSFVTLAAWLAVMLLTAGPGFAATFTVDTTADAVDAMPGNGTCATAGAACSLRAAIQEANALAGADAITLPAGTYVLSVPGVGDNAALQGDLDVTADLTLTGAGAATTIVDGGGIDRVFDIRAGTVTFGGLTVRNGNVQGCGGGLASQTTFTLHDAVVTANTAQSGGGLCNEAHPPYTVVLTLDNVAVRSNMGTEGGGIANVSYGEVEFPFSYGTATVTTVNTVVADNHADDGGGIASIANLGVAAIHTNTTTIRDNVAIGDGGGVFLGGTLTIGFPITSIASLDARDSTISGNMATSGGGIDGLPAYLTASTVSGNHASLDGGGLRGCWTIDDSTISGNTSDRNGGGIAEPSDGCTLRGVTISDNTADADADGSGDGGGMSTTGRHVVDLRNTIIGRNVDMGSESPDCAGEIGSSGHNLLEQPSGCLIAGDPTGNVAGLDPKLGPLANNGGATLTHALLTGSPALDAGAGCNATDQRGSARPQGPACDIGAVEQLYAPTACGNGALDGGEACDDGNFAYCDGCTPACEIEAGVACGDGITSRHCGEQCDDGNPLELDGCTPACMLERIPGGGKSASDCLSEWSIDNPTNVPPRDPRGDLVAKQRCVDDDSRCDFDGGVTGSCTFHLRVCANNTDVAGCFAPPRLADWQLDRPSAWQAAKRPTFAAVRDALVPAVPVAIVGPIDRDVCTDVRSITVPLRGSPGRYGIGTLTLKAHATSYGGDVDKDKLALVCVPAT